MGNTIPLKPCPFCGGKAELYYAPYNKMKLIPCYSAFCTECRIMIGTTKNNMTDFFRTKEEAAEAWNRRASDAEDNN